MSQFTSRSEFDLEKRVHFTNEIPPYDMFDGLNSVLQTDLWKWVLGYTRVEFGLPYTIDVETDETDSDGNAIVTQDRDVGIDNGEVYYKMVNGTVVEDVQYGPSESENTTYHKLEEYGVVLPEFDYLLHEIYRYMGTMYPDHPDMIKLLTANEFDDMITNAGSVIDYEPDNKFFDKVAESFNNLTEDEQDIEAAMLKIRNLKNEGFRKRLYGSKMGYRMLANDIFQTATVFPVATYLPIKPIDKDAYRSGVGTYDYVIYNQDGTEYARYPQRSVNDGTADLTLKDGQTLEKEYLSPITDADKLKTWNEETGHSYTSAQYDDYIRQHNRIIDTYSKYYYKKFRLIDLDGSNSSYPKPEDSNLYTYGYTVPFHEFNLYEYPASSDSSSIISSASYSSTVVSSDFDSETSYVMSIEDDIPLKTITYTYSNGEYGNNVSVVESTGEEIHNIKTSLKNYVPYKTLTIYPPFVDAIVSNEEFEAIYYKNLDALSSMIARSYPPYNMLPYYYSSRNSTGFTKSRIAEIIDHIDVIYNPFVKDTLLLTPSNTIKFYPKSVTTVSNGDGNFYVSETPLVWDAIEQNSYVAIEDLSEENTSDVTAVAQVTNFTKGYIDIAIDSDIADTNAQLFDIAEDQYEDDRYALVVENSDGNYVVFEGKLTTTTTVSGGRYVTTSEHFDIAAIPNKKTTYMLSLLYGDDYTSTYAETQATGYQKNVEAPVTLRDYIDACVENGYDEELARNYYSDDDDVYEAAKASIQDSGLDYTTFLKKVKSLIACEEQLDAWYENRKYIYNETSYTVDDEEVPYEEALIYPGCTVVSIMKCAVPTLNANEPEYNTITTTDTNGNEVEEQIFNDDYYQNNVTYSLLTESNGYFGGEIEDISLGNLNVASVYGYDENKGAYVPATAEVVDTPITITSTDGRSLTFNCLVVDNNITEHDTTTITDYNSIQHTFINYYEQAFSTLDETLTEYTTGMDSSSLTNLTISPIERETIQIECVIDIQTEGKERLISFESDAAREMFKSLSVGDIITGPSIDSDDNDVFIVDVGDNEVTVNVDLQQSGTFLLNFDVKTNVSPEDIEDNLVQYKEDLYNNGLYSVTNPFEHGLWPSDDFPRVSTAILDSLPDISFYDIYNYRNGTNNSFTTILEDTHYDEYQELLDDGGSTSKYLIPSDIKFNNELFLELNLNKLIYFPTHKNETTPVLMSVDWLDYIENSLMYSSRATDNVNVGVNLMMETDTTGYYTLIEGQSYTDPQVQLKFITLNLNNQNMWPEKVLTDDDWVTPCYAQVGTGGSGRKRWFKSPDDVSYPPVWGSTVYDNIKDSSTYDEDSDFYKENGELRNVGVWGQNQSEFNSKTNTIKYTSVENPLFEIPLGEYDTITKYVYGNNSRNLLSITQASFYSQTFTDILKHFDADEDKLKIIGTDISNGNILTSYGNDSSRAFTYSGIWTPTKTAYYDEDGVITDYFSVVYPENPTNMTYYVVDEDINLSNIGTCADDKTSRTFSRSDVLFRYNNKWYLKSFQYMGLVGDGFDRYDPTYDNAGNLKTYTRTYSIEDIKQPVGTECHSGYLIPYYNDDGSVKTDENGEVVYKSDSFHVTLIERLIQYYLSACKNLSTSYYSDVVPNLGFKEYGHFVYPEGFNYANPSLYTRYTFYDAFKELSEITPIHNDHILYYLYAGTFTTPSDADTILDSLWTDTKGRSWLTENIDVQSDIDAYLEWAKNGADGNADDYEEITSKTYSIPTTQDYTTTFNVGDRIALVNFCEAYAEDSTTQKDSDENYIECDNPDNWFLFKVNTDTLLGATLPISQWRYVQDTEVEIIADTYDSYPDNAEKVGISTLLDNTCSVIDLPRSYITEGSYNFNITVDPHFLSEGYLYEDDGLTLNQDDDHLVTFCTTKGAIYYDDTNEVFYTFSNVQQSDGTLSSETSKVALKFNEQKFFKNTLKIPGIYQVTNTILTGESEQTQTPTFKSITGVEFPMDKLATGDRLLEVKKLDLRSIYATSLEPVFFSNYYNINYSIKGITTDNELYLSYVPSSSTDVVEKMNFTTNVANLLPVNNVYDEDTNSYTSELATTDTTITFGDEFANPTLSNISITKSLNDDTISTKESNFINREFGYYKNNLVVRGRVDTTQPKVLLTPSVDGSMFKEAITKISTGDTLVGAYALGPTGNEQKFKIQIIVDGTTVSSAQIQYAYFANNQFRAVEKSGIVYYNDDIDVPSVTTDIKCKRASMFETASARLYSGDVNMVGYTQDLGWYVEIANSSSSTVICTMDITTDNEVVLQQAYMGNGKHVFVDYNNSSSHTLVGHTIGEYDTDYITPTTLTIIENGVSTGLCLMSEDTTVDLDGVGNKVWTTPVKENNTLKYTVKTIIEETEEFFKVAITDDDTLEEINSKFDGNMGNATNYNISKLDTDGNVIMYLVYTPSSTSDNVEATIARITYDENKVPSYSYSKATVYISEEDGIWREYTYGNASSDSSTVTTDSTVYTYQNSDTVLKDLDENGVVTGLGSTYTSDADGTTEEQITVFYRDIALTSAKLTQSSSDSNLYTVDDDYTSEPYFTDTAMITYPNGSSSPTSDNYSTRALLKKDNSGKYTVYAKGRSLFVKSPTSLLEKDSSSGSYAYNGSLTAESFWKHAYAPIFNEHMFLTIRSTLVNDKASVDSLVDMSLVRLMATFGNKINLEEGINEGITVDGRALDVDRDNTLVENLKAVFIKLSGYTGYDDDAAEVYYDNKVTYDTVVDAMDYAKKNAGSWYKADGSHSAYSTSSNDVYPLVVMYSGTTWTFRCYGFKIIEETVTDGYSVIGASKQKFAQLPESVSELKNFYETYTMDDDASTPNYEHAYAMFAYYFTYYLCGNAENTDIVSSSNISDVQFTDNSMLVTDTRGNINSIGLCYLHNRDDIENPEHWSQSTPPMELSCYAVERNVVGTANYKIGSQYLSVPKPEVLTKQNTFVVESSYANDEIILMGGYILPQTGITAIYDDFMRGDKSDSEYQTWKANRSDDEKAVETQLLEPSKFENNNTPILLYSVDNGSTFEQVTLTSTSGMSLNWEDAVTNNTDPDGDYYVSGIVYADKEYKVFLSKEGSDDNLDYYYYFEADDDDGSFDFSATTGTKVMDEYGDISKAHEFDLDAVTGTSDVEVAAYSGTSSVNTIPSGYYRMMFTEGENCFYILSSMAVNFGENVTVSSKTSGSITLSTQLVSPGTSEFEILLAFNTKENISDATQYINMDRADKYVSEIGELRVPEVTEVDSSETCNRFYSYREVLQEDERTSENGDPYGYPSVSEDTEYTLYEYDTVYDADTGDTSYTPKTMTNKYDETVYLCDGVGKHLIYRAENGKHILGTLSMRGTYPLSMFMTASIPTYTSLAAAEADPSIRASDDEFQNLLDLTDSNVVSLCYDNTTPYVKVSTGNTILAKDVEDYLFTESETEDFAKYIEATSTGFGLMDTSTAFLDESGNTSITKIKEAIADITYNAGTTDDVNLKTLYTLEEMYTSLEDSTTTDSDGNVTTTKVTVSHTAWYDNQNKEFILKKKRYLSALAYVPYCFKAGITAYKNVGFPTVDGSGGIDVDTPITGVYLSNYGYGGSRSNKDLWENTLPWLVDPDAFSDSEYLTNTNGDQVYLVDAGGSEIKSYNAETARTVGEAFTLGIDNLNGASEKDIYAYSSTDSVFTSSVYKPTAGTPTVYTPLDTLTLGENPFEIDLTVFKSYKLIDIDTKQDSDGNIVPNISIRYYGMTKKNTYNEISCDRTDSEKGITPDFEYDAEKKVLRYLGSTTLENSFYVSTDNTVNVSKLNVVFYVDGTKYSVSYKLKFAQDPVITTTMNDKGVLERTMKIVGSSSYSIHFNAFTLYQYKNSSYSIVTYQFDKDTAKYTNSATLHLEIGTYDSDMNYEPISISLTNITQSCLLNSQYDSLNHYLVMNNKSVVDTPSDYLKIMLDDNQYTINVPINTLGKVVTYEDYIVSDVAADKENKKLSVSGEWYRQTYIDDIKLDNLYVVNYNSDLTVTLSDSDNISATIVNDEDSATSDNTTSTLSEETEGYEISTFKNVIPSILTTSGLSGYYINFLDGSVFDTLNGVDTLRISIIKIDIEGELSDTVYTNGIYARIPCRKPNYDSFRDLINAKSFVIDKGSDSILYERNDDDVITISATDPDSVQFSLTENLDIDGYNDGEEHYIIMKWLTQSTIRTDLSICNDTDAFTEVSLSDKKLFTPDRVWFNPNGYPTPTVTIGNNVYNAENNEEYESESYKNNNGYTIYRCNEEGCLVGYTSNSDSTVIASYDNDNDGLPEDVEGYILNTDGTVKSIAREYVLNPNDNVLADAMIPKKPSYESCQEWFENEFYIKGHESNPYWQVLRISSKFNNAKKLWEQYMSVNEYVRSTQEMALKTIDTDDRYINPVRAVTFEQKDSSYIISTDADIVNLTDGSLRFILDRPSDKYQTEEQFVKYGITATNPFYGDSIWTGSNLSLACYLDSTYTVCSTENLADPRDTESEVQEVTEFGLFNKYHQLIAYAVFPPIEYRTNSQHISFTCYVKQGSCVDPSTLTE